MVAQVFVAVAWFLAGAQQICAIEFEPDSSRVVLTADQREELATLVAWANDTPDALIVIDGHAAEPRLALRRARAVEAELVVRGANPQQIFVAAFGVEPGKRPRVIVWTTLRGAVD